ncbi:MAG: D-glycero-beta-D-manno-heptose-7-phosphate kinase [Okeania sp. SIO2G4]|uniref:bifunctional heptose 7-phosphate kinase/heptose 1-phosphate adenyltransferase n=1 Tax=unclassified Okeania TaxID=2634635 RepID=UPI0013BD08AF|nr:MULTISPECIES: PfkB family carbohydrate kinase [unclassified Okeania]NEP41983.1 D-glycero-beta-D-manno-heptose-7-phosphate kinase [Okeania sp. SIO2H7]NEP73838.1 D-glycero-beta-D-manno-heptose-7-phosphate kinase [Okeania sp. SIO2G5]NEP94536.1 D-glycero-beta-D-manno-heptose-7-phosphate kinase [Okeania sp. SIO2F5]NEQ92396.1 D-glycero-beta-D-manno-heptose-7-phosphate kinase [Okeania sp. SIO2G4]
MVLDSEFLTQLKAATPRLLDLLAGFSQVEVLVVGDLTLDEFMTGQVERVSREAPVLILRHETTEQVPGGGANAVYNFAKLGAKVKVVGLLGKDEQGKALRHIFETARVDTSGILVDPNRPTVTKTRISGHARQSVTQQIVRVDRKSDDLPEVDLQLQLAEYIQRQVATVDAVICSDYGDGVLTTPVIEAAISHPQRTIVDTQKDLQRYKGATIFTPNLPEAEKAVGYAITNSDTLYQAGSDLLRLTDAEQVLITRGEEGMSLFDRVNTSNYPSPSFILSGTGDTPIYCWHIPAFNRTDVFDVTGAGDTVVAALTLALSMGASSWEASVLGNLAASLVVRIFGTATTTVNELREALQALVS